MSIDPEHCPPGTTVNQPEPPSVPDAIHVEYEIPPLRAVYMAYFYDDGQSDDYIREAFAEIQPRGRIRKITRTAAAQGKDTP